MTNLDRSEINRALAKAIAYKQVGNHKLAAAWAVKLIDLLDASDILDQREAMFWRGDARNDEAAQGSNPEGGFSGVPAWKVLLPGLKRTQDRPWELSGALRFLETTPPDSLNSRRSTSPFGRITMTHSVWNPVRSYRRVRHRQREDGNRIGHPPKLVN